MSAHDTTHRYETKCRRCGNLTVYYSGIEKWEDFVNYCCAQAKQPQAIRCDTCQRQTFQDFVSYFMQGT
jgi:hypothetical protein